MANLSGYLVSYIFLLLSWKPKTDTVLLYLSGAISCHWGHTEALIKMTIHIGIGRSLGFF